MDRSCESKRCVVVGSRSDGARVDALASAAASRGARSTGSTAAAMAATWARGARGTGSTAALMAATWASVAALKTV